MKKRKRTKDLSSASAPVEGAEPLHIRLCHVCLHLNESERDIEQCQKCQRYLTIENLVEERLSRHAREQELEEMEMMGAAHARKGGLNGLAVRW